VTEAGLHRKQYSATGSVSILAVRTIVEPVTIFGSGRVRNAAGASEMARIELSRLKQYVAETERQQTLSLWQLQQCLAQGSRRNALRNGRKQQKVWRGATPRAAVTCRAHLCRSPQGCITTIID
jgi:hypothetical protein